MKPISLIYVLLPFSYYFIGPVIFTTYAYALRSFLSRWQIDILLTTSFVLMFWVILMAKSDIAGCLVIIRYFWGWLFFYIFFSRQYHIDLSKLLTILSIIVIVEAVLVNTVISASVLPNYPPLEHGHSHFAAIGEYQRPYSFGASASVTSCILVALMSHLRLRIHKSILPIVAIATLMSGVGFFLLLLYFLYQYRHLILINIFIFPSLLFLFLNGMVTKFSWHYTISILEDKLKKIKAFTDQSVEYIFFGDPIVQVMDRGGDFQILSLLKTNGSVGLLVLLLVLLLNVNRSNWFPILILFLGTLHYGVIFYFPGQFLFGYFLALRNFSKGQVERNPLTPLHS